MKNNKNIHKRIALIALTKAGLTLAFRLEHKLEADVHIYASQRAHKEQDALSVQDAHVAITSFETVGSLLSEIWNTYDQIVLFLALGAVVRLIASFLQHKHRDPGIVAIDDAGQCAISVVSGHMGDANGLAMRCAELLGATPIVTTASDVHNTLAVDLLAQEQGWYLEDASALTAVSAAIVNHEPVGILQDCGKLDWWNDERPWPDNLIRVTHAQEASNFAALLVITDHLIEDLPQHVPTLVYRPPTLVLGTGCRRGISFSALDIFIKKTLAEHHIAFQSITTLATADIKANEEALQIAAQRYGWNFETHTAETLKTITEIANPSERVQRLIGTPSVSEAAAIISSNGGELLVPKQKGQNMTLAIARKIGSSLPDNVETRFIASADHASSVANPSSVANEPTAHTGHLAIIGLGPGSRDLLAARAIHMLHTCDLIVGYKLYLEQIQDLLADKDVHVSELTQEVERAKLAVQQAINGKRVCIISSGDAGIYGMAGLVLDLLSSARAEVTDNARRPEPEVEVIPGISALNAAAALLGAPLMHDFAVISLSDLLTPWNTIARRLSAAAAADFVVVLYNPSSRKRHWQLGEAQRLLLANQAVTTPVGIVRNAYRPEQQVWITTLEHILDYKIDMFTTIIVGNSCTRVQQGRMITPRGYDRNITVEDNRP